MFNRVTVTWATRREGNDGYVLETYRSWDGHVDEHEFGPMPPALVTAFCVARRRLVATKMDDEGNPYVLTH